METGNAMGGHRLPDTAVPALEGVREIMQEDTLERMHAKSVRQRSKRRGKR